MTGQERMYLAELGITEGNLSKSIESAECRLEVVKPLLATENHESVELSFKQRKAILLAFYDSLEDFEATHREIESYHA